MTWTKFRAAFCEFPIHEDVETKVHNISLSTLDAMIKDDINTEMANL